MGKQDESESSKDSSSGKQESSSTDRPREENRQDASASAGEGSRYQDNSTNTDNRSRLLEGSYVPPRFPPQRDFQGRYEWEDEGGRHPRPFPPNVGGADLDPLNRGGGGMIMDPRDLIDPRNGRHGGRFPGGARIPPGSIPPGARFDPFGPPGLGPGPFGPFGPGRSGGRGPPFGPGAGGPPTNFFGPNPDHMRPPSDYDDMFM